MIEDRAVTARRARAEALALALVILVAAALRLGWPGISEFKADEAHIAALALDLAQGRAFPLRGIATSVGLPKPAISIYLYALPFALSAGPLAATLFTGALNVATVAFCWWLGRRYGGRVAGLCAAWLFATSPWAAFFSRKIWEPNVMPAFVSAYVATGLLGFLEGRRWAQGAHLLSLALVAQLHYHGLLVVPLTALFLLIGWRRIDRRAVLVGLLLAALTAVPFGYDLLSRAQGMGGALFAFLARPSRVDGESFGLWWALVTGSDIHAPAGPQAYVEFLKALPGLSPLHGAAGALAVGGIAYGLWRWARRRDEAGTAAGIIAMWAILPPLLTLRHATPLHLHYFTALLPAPYLAAGLLLARAASCRRGAARWAALGGAVAVGLGQALVFVALLGFLGMRATPGGFGVPLRVLLQVRERALALGPPVAVVGRGDDPQTGEWVAVFDVLLRDVPHRFVDGSHAALWPAAPATLILAPGAEAACAIYAEAGLFRPEQVVPGRLGEEGFRVLRWEGRHALTLSPIGGMRALENGAEWIGYRLRASSKGTAEWEIAWRVWKPPDPAARYHIFNHLEDAEGKVWVQADGATVPAQDWAVGDVVVQRFLLQVPPEAGDGPFSMRVGMYSYPDMGGVSVLDVAANPAGQSLSLGPLEMD